MENNRELPWTGERFVPSCTGQLLYEHLHRYAVAATLADGKRVLDIACGEGYGSNLLAATAAQVIGVDIASEVIAHARQAYRKENLIFREGSCLNIPVEDHSIDLVVSFETIEHIDEPLAFLQEIKRVLAVDGALIMSSPDKAEYTDRTGATNPFHKRELYHEEFLLLLKQHFKRCRIGKQKLVAGSWIAADDLAAEDTFGTFSGDIHSIAFHPGIYRGVYSLALCSDARLPAWKLGVYANSRESERIWDLLERFGSPENIQNTVASLEQRAARQAELLAQLKNQLNSSRVGLTRAQARVDELTGDLRRQLLATKKLTWLLSETEKSAARLRASRRWKIANPFAALKAFLSGREVEGYGHLEKIVSDYLQWRPHHPEVSKIDERIGGLEHPSLGSPPRLAGPNGSTAAPITPPAPTKPIEFPVRDSVDVSVIIPVFNQLQFTQSSLASIQDNQADQSLEVIVVDDSSTDGTEETLPRIPGLVYLRNKENVGFVASCNRGAAKARGNYLVFLNNDTVVTAGWLSALRETFQFEPHAGLVGSKLIYPDGRLQEAGGIIWRDGSGWNRGKFDDPRKPEYNFLREVDYCSAACLMLPKSLFQSVGGFDIHYVPAYYEDTDLAFKVRAAGFKVLYQPLSEVFHFEGATGGTDISTGTKKHQEINRKAFAAKWKEALATKPANGDVAALEQLPQGYKRILVIDHSLPMPDRDSGSLRMFQILTILPHLGHRVSFIPDNLANIPPYGDDLRKRGIEVVLRPHIKDVSNYIESHGRKYDVIILSRCGTAKKHIAAVRLHAPQSHVIFDTVDLHFLRTAREAELTQKAEAKMLAEQTQEQEYSLIKEADETWVVSEAERELLLHDFPGKQIEVVSNIVNIQAPKTSFAERAGFLFIGSFLHPPNVDAVLYFVNDIYPLVTQTLPAVKFYIIGHQAPPEIVALGSENIIVVGAVPEVLSFFESVKLSVAPLRYGAGVKGKINQSMGFGVPVIATSIAVEGMCLRDRQDVLIADKPEEFASALIDLYQSEDLWRRLSGNSLKKTKSLYSADAATRQLSRLFSERHIAESTPLSIVNREKTYPTR
jgi:GT2 family glycosyltransferase/SAM-dependent methyltransferase/glycosyltransferase involved in cell wall biosynthesis